MTKQSQDLNILRINLQLSIIIGFKNVSIMNISNEEQVKSTKDKKNSSLIMASFGCGVFLSEFFNAAAGAFGFFYYETEVGLNVWLVSLAFSLYAIWNAINDPLIGYLVDRPQKFWLKWGRRFPWIFGSAVPWFICLVLMYSAPDVDPTQNTLLLFFWLLISMCLYDTFYSIYSVSYYSLVPEKFRLDTERRRVQGFSGTMGFIAMMLGFIVPSLLVSYGNRSSYSFMAWVIFFSGIVVLVALIPGVREDKSRIVNYLEREHQVENDSFVHLMVSALKQKNFLIFIFVYFMNQVLMGCLGSSIHYVVRYVLQESSDAALIVYLGYFIGTLSGVPIWVKIGQKLNNNKKLLIILGFLLVVAQIPLMFIGELGLIGTAIMVIPYGFSFAGFWTTLTIPISADVIDDVIINLKRRKESTFNGIRAFFARLAIVAQSLIFAIVHQMTGFIEGAETQSPLAQFGILSHLALIPLILIFIATIVFWKFYDITSERKKIMLQKMKELGL